MTPNTRLDAYPGNGAPENGRTFLEWIALLASRWRALLIALTAGLAIGAVYSFTEPTLYEATSTVVLSPASGPLDPSTSENLPVIADTLAERRVDDLSGRLHLPALPLAGDDAEDLPHVLLRFVVFLAFARHDDQADEPPTREIAEVHVGVAAADREGRHHLVRGQRLRGEEEVGELAGGGEDAPGHPTVGPAHRARTRPGWPARMAKRLFHAVPILTFHWSWIVHFN